MPRPIDPRRWNFSTIFSHPDTQFVRLDMMVTIPRRYPRSHENCVAEEFSNWAWAELRMAEFETDGSAAAIWRMVPPYCYRVMQRGRALGLGVDFHLTYMRNGCLEGR